MSNSPFDNQLLRKYSIVFGTFFNDIVIQRTNNPVTNSPDQKFLVPIEFGPREKYIALTQAKPGDKKRAMILPRMSFEITGMQFDTTRKIERRNIIRNQNHMTLRGAPWNINFQLSIMSKNLFDATKIVEQILFRFQPDYTVDVKLLKDFDHIDRITTQYNGISHEDQYEGDFQQRRLTVWTIDFVMKAWLYGPIDEGKQIKLINIDTHASLDEDSNYDLLTIQPGLDANGNPTYDVNTSIPYQDINEDDNYAVIVNFQEGLIKDD